MKIVVKLKSNDFFHYDTAYQKLTLNMQIQYNLLTLRYGDGAGNTVEENSSVFSLMWMR